MDVSVCCLLSYGASSLFVVELFFFSPRVASRFLLVFLFFPITTCCALEFVSSLAVVRLCLEIYDPLLAPSYHAKQ